ncbi:hypothetical protein MTO96_037031 [Rhipicephalus appendiculatus]
MKQSHKSGIIKQFGLQITQIRRCKSCRVARATTRHIGAKFVPTDNGDTLYSLYNKFTAIKIMKDTVFDICEHAELEDREIISVFPRILLAHLSRHEAVLRNAYEVDVAETVTFMDFKGSLRTYCVNSATSNEGVLEPQLSHYIATVENAKRKWKRITRMLEPNDCSFEGV